MLLTSVWTGNNKIHFGLYPTPLMTTPLGADNGDFLIERVLMSGVRILPLWWGWVGLKWTFHTGQDGSFSNTDSPPRLNGSFAWGAFRIPSARPHQGKMMQESLEGEPGSVPFLKLSPCFRCVVRISPTAIRRAGTARACRRGWWAVLSLLC